MNDYYTAEDYYVPGVSDADVNAALGYDIPPAYTWLSGMSETAAQEGPGVQGADNPTAAGSYQASALDPLRAFLSNPSMQAFNSLMRSGVGMGGTVGLMALLGALNRSGPSGGGYTGTASPTPTNRTMVQGKYGPIAQYAAQGGLMHAYAHGGAVTGTHKNPLRMEDGGFVMTKRAVDGAGGPRGIAQMLPGARPIVGPGTGTSDHIPATIAGRTPARVSNGEAYVPKRAVNQAGGAKALYALMNQLQRRA
jgi:hypothetical protein